MLDMNTILYTLNVLALYSFVALFILFIIILIAHVTK